MSDAKSLSEFRALFGENELRSTSKEYYEWKIFKNPYGQGKIYLESKQGIVVGSSTITPKKVSIWGKELMAAELGEAFTHPEYRRQGIHSKLLNACCACAISQGIEVVYALPSSQTLSLSQKLGYLPCPFIKLNYMTKERRILLPVMRYIAKLILHRKLNPSDLTLSAMLKQRFSRSIFSRSKGSAAKDSFDILTVDKFTDEIDGLWGSPRYAFFAIRDKTYLNWRFFENPDKYQVIAAKRGDEYLGYMVTKLSKNKSFATICDFVTIDDRLDVFNALIQEAEKMGEKAGAQSFQVYCVDGSPYYQAMLDQGYYDYGPARRQPVIVFSGTDYGKTLLQKEGKWYFTLSDSDHI